MPTNRAKSSPRTHRRIRWQERLGIVVLLAAALSLGFLSWIFAAGAWGDASIPYPPAAKYLLIISLHALLTISLKRGLALLPDQRQRARHYRLSFFLSFGVGLARWMLSYLGPVPRPSPTYLAASLAGAWLGALVVTAIEDGLWENNFPPTQEVEAQVLEAHRKRIGVPPPPPRSKRAFDILVATAGILVSLPLWVLITFILWLEDPGPLFFIKNVVGRGGVNFHQWKFRTMVPDAEHDTGPIVSSVDDHRVLFLGRLLRRSALDELPQLVNILLGEMSVVGPRPQRTVLVHSFLSTMPHHVERHRVAPGISGLAQVAARRYISPRQKLRYDLVYTRNVSVGFDLKLLVLALMIVFWLRWRPNWNGHVPPSWVRSARPKTRADR